MDPKSKAMERIEKHIKNFFQKKDNMIILVLTGILLLVIAWPVSDTQKEKKQVSGLWDKKRGNIENNNLSIQNTSSQSYENINTQVIYEGYRRSEAEYLEAKLEEVLSSMYGVGKVKTMITLADSGEKIIEKDVPLDRSNIVENDSSGGSRNTNEMNTQETTVYITNSDGEKIPYVIKEKSPLVEGVIVVAEGGGSHLVQKHISDVIQALFGIEPHKIIVVKMKQEG